MAEGSTSLKGLRAQMAAAAQAQAEERRGVSGNSPVPPSTTVATAAAVKPQGPKPVIDGAALKIDDRLRVARERREEAERQHAARDSQIAERERKAKLQVERQMEERQRKLDDQRRKEELRRSAVEEKRKQKQEEEKEHYEAVMRRTLERSQRVDLRQKRWSWGGLSTDSDGRTGDSDASSPVAITISPASPPEKPPRRQQVDKRSTSTTNLKQPPEAGISKRLSSSITLVKSPDPSAKRRSASCNRLPGNNSAAKGDAKKPHVEQTGPSQTKRSSSLSRVGGGRAQTPIKPSKVPTDDQARRPQASTVDGGGLSRLLTHTQASLARSKSTAALSAEGRDAPECHLCPRSAGSSPVHPAPRGPLRSRSIDRQKIVCMTTSASDGALDPSLKEKRPSTPRGERPASPSSFLGRHRSPSPAPKPSPKRTPSPAAAKQSPRTRQPSPGVGRQRPPSPQPTTPKPPPIQKPALTPTGPPTLRKRDPKPREPCGPIQAVAPPSEGSTGPSPGTSSSKVKDREKDDAKSGTNSAAEAAKILAENRRLAREQKERDELLRVQREEEEKLRAEEEKRQAEEALLRHQEEEKRLAEERKVREEEEAVRAEEERVRLAAQEELRQAALQREREEVEAKAQEEAERVRLERERVMHQNQQERMARKKRIEEIMKRTRKGDQSDLKRDDDDGLQEENDEDEDYDENDEEEDQIDCETKKHAVDVTMETDLANKDRCSLSSGEPIGERREPLGSVNGKQETDDKQNNNCIGCDNPQAVSPLPKSRLVEGSEFQDESPMVDHVPGLNGKPGPWSFEELIDISVHAKVRPLIEAEGCNPTLIDCEGDTDVPRVALEDKGTPG